MRKLSEVLTDTPYVEVRDESPAGSSDDTTRLTRRNGRTYEVNVNDRLGYVGVSEVVMGDDGEERWISCYFAQDGETYDLYTFDGSIKTPKAIVSYLGREGVLDA